MTVTSVLPYFILTMVFLLVAHVLATRSQIYHQTQSDDSVSRYESLDGLRGFLAFGVFFTHALVTHFYYLNGVWTLPPSHFYSTLGEASVALFFMITAFLFWGKVLDKQGRISAGQLYRSRHRRLSPMYAFSVVVVLVIVAFRTNFELQVPPKDLLIQIVRWFSYGFLGIPEMPDVNGLADTHTIESVYWTLTFEWQFYLLLPLLAVLPARTTMLVALMSITIFFGPPPIVAVNFALGALAAVIVRRYPTRESLNGRWFDVLILVLVIMILSMFPRGHGLPQYLLLFIVFILLVSGNDLFGLLTSRAATLLGTVSYSVYLMHNIILNQVFYTTDLFYKVVELPAPMFWILVGISGIIVIAVSVVTYRYVEYPFLKKPSTAVRPIEVSGAMVKGKVND